MNRIRAILLLLATLLSALASTQEEGGKIVLGKLGQALQAANIHASPTTKSRIYYRLKPYEYIVLTGSNASGWLRVLLQNGSHGYIRSEAIARLPYDVTADAPAAASRSNDLASRSRAAAAALGTRLQGVPYKWGGNDPLGGIDCSGFVKFLFGQIGQDLPRTAAEQALVGKPLYRFEDLQAGDRLYFWDAKRGKIGHTGIYLGNGYFVHSSAGKGGVSTDFLGEEKWRRILVAARR